MLGLVFGRMDFCGFCFEPSDFVRGFCRRTFSHLCGKKCPEKSSRKIPRQILQENPPANPPKITTKSPTYFCRGAGPKYKRKGFRPQSYFGGKRLLGWGHRDVPQTLLTRTTLIRLFSWLVPASRIAILALEGGNHLGKLKHLPPP